MSELERAARDAVEAQANSEQVAMVLAILQAQQLTQHQPAPALAPVHQRPIGAYVALGIGGAVALTGLAMAAALLAVAVAVGAISATVCLLVLRSMWNDQKGK